MAYAYSLQHERRKELVAYGLLGLGTAAFAGLVLVPWLKSLGLRAQGRFVEPDPGLRGYVGYNIGVGNWPGGGFIPGGAYRAARLAFGVEQGAPFVTVPGYPWAVQPVAERAPTLGALASARLSIEEHSTSAPHDPVDLGVQRPVDSGQVDDFVVTEPPTIVTPYGEQIPLPYRAYAAISERYRAKTVHELSYRQDVREGESRTAPAPAAAIPKVGEQSFPVYYGYPSFGQPLPAGGMARLAFGVEQGAPFITRPGVSDGFTVQGVTNRSPPLGARASARQAIPFAEQAEAFYPVERSTVAPGFSTVYRDLSLANTIDIQTQDYPGGEGSYNLAVGNLPDAANGNLNAPVTRQQLAPAGGIAESEIAKFSRAGPLLFFPA